MADYPTYALSLSDANAVLAQYYACVNRVDSDAFMHNARDFICKYFPAMQPVSPVVGLSERDLQRMMDRARETRNATLYK